MSQTFSETFRALARVALALCVLAVAVLAFAPLQETPLLSYDKGNHILAFFVMAWLADLSWPGRRYALARWSWLLSYGLLIEVIQRELPLRHFSWLDVSADVLGIALYCVTRTAFKRYRSTDRSEA